MHYIFLLNYISNELRALWPFSFYHLTYRITFLYFEPERLKPLQGDQFCFCGISYNVSFFKRSTRSDVYPITSTSLKSICRNEGVCPTRKYSVVGNRITLTKSLFVFLLKILSSLHKIE